MLFVQKGSFCICALCFIVLNENVGHKQSRDGGEGQAQPRGPGQAWGTVAQVCGTARLRHLVQGGAGVADRDRLIRSLVALSHGKTALRFDTDKTSCGETKKLVHLLYNTLL